MDLNEGRFWKHKLLITHRMVMHAERIVRYLQKSNIGKASQIGYRCQQISLQTSLGTK